MFTALSENSCQRQIYDLFSGKRFSSTLTANFPCIMNNVRMSLLLHSVDFYSMASKCAPALAV